MTDDRDPVLRVVPRREDINSNGHIFGGWILAQMDIAAGIVAARRASGPVATVAVDAMKFLQPILMGDVLSVHAAIGRTGRTSVAVKVEVVAHRDRGTRDIAVTEGVFTMVAIGESGRPRELPPG